MHEIAPLRICDDWPPAVSVLLSVAYCPTGLHENGKHTQPEGGKKKKVIGSVLQRAKDRFHIRAYQDVHSKEPSLEAICPVPLESEYEKKGSGCISKTAQKRTMFPHILKSLPGFTHV